MIDAPFMVRAELHRRDPALPPLVKEAVEALQLLGTSASPGTLQPWRPDVEHLVTQASNDFLDLLFDCLHGRGRSALRCARTLFELAITMRDITRSEEMAQRYADHWLIGGVLFGSLRREADALQGAEQREFRFRLDRLKSGGQQAFEALTVEHGDRFDRDWAGRSIFDGARDNGLEDDYRTFYRWASAASHGTGAGMQGHFRVVSGRPLYRLGPAMELCPTAFIHGLDYFNLILNDYRPLLTSEQNIEPLRIALDELRSHFGAYRSTILWMDEEAWPHSPPRDPCPVVGIGQDGSLRWYLHDRAKELIIQAALDDNLPAETFERLRDIGARHDQAGVWDPASRFPIGPSGLISIHILDLDARPLGDAVWRPSRELFPRFVDGTVGSHGEQTLAAIVSGAALEEVDRLLGG